MSKILTAANNKVFAYKDENNKEQIMGKVIALGKYDSGEEYYEIDDPNENKEIMEG